MPTFELGPDDKPEKLEPVPFGKEKKLHDYLEKYPESIKDDIFIIGREVYTSDGKYIDLLGIDKSGSAVIIELKKEKTPREVIAQIIQYAEWVANEVDPNKLNEIAKDKGCLEGFSTIWKKFESVFGFEPQALNESQKLYIVAEEIHPHTVKMAKYLRETCHLDIMCIEMKLVKNDAGKKMLQTNFVVGKEKLTPSSHKLDDTVEKNYGWNHYSNYLNWDDKVIEELQRICDYISKYSEERGWKLHREYNQGNIIFRRAPPEVKEKFADRRVIELKSYYGNPDDKVRMFFNWLKDPDKKPAGNFDYKYNTAKHMERWYFDIERDGKLDLSSHSDFEKVLVQAYNATTER